MIETTEHDERLNMISGTLNSDSDEFEVNYYQTIDECADSAENKLIENGMPAHATYLMTKMFMKAEEHVRLFSGNLAIKVSRNGNEKVYSSDKLIKEVIDFLKNRKGKLDIVLENDIDGEPNKHPLVVAIKEANLAKNIKICKLTKDAGLREKNHFMVMDNKAYRVEYDHGNTKAVANFGDHENTIKWVEYFDNTLLKYSNPILI